MNTKTFRRLTGAITLLALAVPAVAAAHPTIYEETAITAVAKEVQTITVSATSGSFQPSAGSTSVSFDASAADVQVSLETDAALPDGLLVTGAAGGPYTITFPGFGDNIAQVVPDAGTLAGGTGVTAGTTTQGSQTTETRYMIAQHGYPLVLKEANGDTTSGMLSYAAYPSAVRAGKTMAQKLTAWPQAVTGVQPHAQCTAMALQNPAVIAEWQASESDPFYGYVPFQKTAIGIDDDANDWIGVVKTATGVDLATINTAAEAQTACAGIGGTYVPADLPASGSVNVIGGVAGGAANGVFTGWAKKIIDEAAVPKDAQIAALTGEKTTLTADKAKLAADKAAAEQALAAAKLRPLSITAGAKVLRSSNAFALVTGTAGTKVKVQVTVTKAKATSLGLSSNVLGTATVKLDGQGAGIVTVKLGRVPANKVAASRSDVPVSLVATAGSETDAAKASIDS